MIHSHDEFVPSCVVSHLQLLSLPLASLSFVTKYKKEKKCCKVQLVPTCKVQQVPTCKVQHVPTCKVQHVPTCKVQRVSTCKVQHVSTCKVQRVSTCKVQRVATCKVRVPACKLQHVTTCKVQRVPTCKSIKAKSKLILLNIQQILTTSARVPACKVQQHVKSNVSPHKSVCPCPHVKCSMSAQTKVWVAILTKIQHAPILGVSIRNLVQPVPIRNCTIKI